MANSILAGSKYSNAYARNMLYGILSEVHARVPIMRLDQNVDDLVQCALGCKTVVIRKMLANC